MRGDRPVGPDRVAELVYNPAVAAMLPQVAGEDELAAANALNGTIENLTVVTGPAIGRRCWRWARPAGCSSSTRRASCVGADGCRGCARAAGRST